MNAQLGLSTQSPLGSLLGPTREELTERSAPQGVPPEFRLGYTGAELTQSLAPRCTAWASVFWTAHARPPCIAPWRYECRSSKAVNSTRHAHVGLPMQCLRRFPLGYTGANVAQSLAPRVPRGKAQLELPIECSRRCHLSYMGTKFA